MGEITSGEKIIITIDGPAGSGKTSSARELAYTLGYRHLDSGALYRAVTFVLLEENIQPNQWKELTADQLQNLHLEFVLEDRVISMYYRQRKILSQLRTPHVTKNVSYISSLPEVRNFLLQTQKMLGDHGRLVADGRDMGATIFPDAEVKFFLTAELVVRARRRLLENFGGGYSPKQLEDEMVLIQERDDSDQQRKHSPLTQAKDSILVDTSRLTFEAQLRVLRKIVKDLTGI